MGDFRTSFTYLADMIFSPRDLADDIMENPKFMLPILINTAIIFALLMICVLNLDTFATFYKMEQSTVDFLKNVGSFVIVFFALITSIVITIGDVVYAALITLFSRVFGGYGTFREFLSLTLYTNIIRLSGFCISTIAIFMSFDFLLSSDISSSSIGLPLFFIIMIVLVFLNPLHIWRLVILTIAVSRIADIRKLKAFAIIILPSVVKHVFAFLWDFFTYALFL